jgi:hypothetical protein
MVKRIGGTNMKKTIHHTWIKITDSGKLKHAVCTRCGIQKYFNVPIGRLIYTDRRGYMKYRTPSCVLPNTHIENYHINN